MTDPTTEDIMRTMLGASARIPSLDADQIRVGSGVAWEHIKRMCESLPKATGHPPIPALSATITGIPIVRDPDIPPDVIQFGTVIWVIGSPGGIIAEGEMVRIDTSAMLTNPLD